MRWKSNRRTAPPSRHRRYTERFYFRAPAAGVGPIVLRVLLKQGDTNGGAFYWPSTGNGLDPPQDGVPAGDLLLPERAIAASPTVEWVRGATRDLLSTVTV